MKKRILIVGGGSGGHVYPLIAVAESLKQKASEKGVELEVLALGEGPFMQRAFRESGIPLRGIVSVKMRRYFDLRNIIDFLKFPLGFFQSLWHIFWFMPDAVLTKGGLSTLMPAFVAKLYFIPLYIHESDAIPGLANRVLGKIADKVFLSFEAAKKYFKANKGVLMGNPVRKELFGKDKEMGLSAFGFNSSLPTILIVPGSQGARRINQAILEVLVELVNKFQVIHQCGESQYRGVRTEADQLIKEGKGEYDVLIQERYQPHPFFNTDQLSLAYAAADVVISRAGAANIFEIAQLGKPVILIPIEKSANDHQLANALELSKYGASVIEEPNLTSHIIINQLEFLLKPEHYKEISEKLKTFATPQAADAIAEALLMA